MLTFFLVVATLAVVALAVWRAFARRAPATPRIPQYVSSMEIFVVGEDQINDDGSDRQELVAACKDGDPILLEPQPKNPHDANAIAVLDAEHRQLGWIPRSQNKGLLKVMGAAEKIMASVVEVQGGTRNKPKVGLVIRIDTYV